MSTSIYCVNNCTRRTTDGEREPAIARHGRLCSSCHTRLHKWLSEIPERFALVPQFLTQGATIEKNPESQTVKRTVAPAPLRVAALDLLDTRLGRKWLGTEPTEDRRGAIGTLLTIANEVRALRGSPPKRDSHVLGEADYLRHSVDLLAAQDWIADAYTEIRLLHRELGDAVGIFPPRPIGSCTNVPADQTENCGGPLLPDQGGVFCPQCKRHWGEDELRFLGRNLTESA